MKNKLIALLTSLFLTNVAHAQKREISTKLIEYKEGDAVLEGYLAQPRSTKTKPRGGFLVVHEWKGIGDHVKQVAEKLAADGYVALAVDIYGKGVRPSDNKEAAQVAGKFRNGDRKLLRARMRAGLETLLGTKLVSDSKNVVAIGYCFGGTAVLEFARDGADVAGVVSFHGGLSANNTTDAKNIKAKVLVLHGADDPNVPEPEVSAFMSEMRGAQVDWQLYAYGNAVHSFTNKSAGNDPSKGSAYNELADKRSWANMQTFVSEIFSQR